MRTSLTLSAALLLVAAAARAQDRPFVFTLTPTTAPQRGFLAHYDAIYGERTFHPVGGDNLEQRIALLAPLLGRVALLVQTGAAVRDASVRLTAQAELLMNLRRPALTGTHVALGVGGLREYGGTYVALARIGAGRSAARWQAHGNVLLEKPFARGRDGVDVITTVGWARRVASWLHVGVEAVGQDLEGFWEAEEAEGGAKLFAGPTFALARPDSRWGFLLSGGPIYRVTQSSRASDASRPLPAADQRNGFVVRAALSYHR